jgi:hypothetical protein
MTLVWSVLAWKLFQVCSVHAQETLILGTDEVVKLLSCLDDVKMKGWKRKLIANQLGKISNRVKQQLQISE